MYNIKGPSKIVTKTTTRRGISQTIDNYRDHNKNKVIENDIYESPNVPKPVFQKKLSPNSQRHENISPQHEEIIKFIHESWNSVCLELDQETGDSDGSTALQNEHLACYYEDEPCVSLQDFKPFDLESWWGKRLYAYITSSARTERNRCKKRFEIIASLLQALEYSIVDSQQSDREVLMAVRLDNLKNNSMKIKVDQLEQENKQLLHMLHLRLDEHCTSRTTSNSSFSTMSMVHLQYKYEELLANQNGLLKILELRISDMRMYQEENAKLKEDIEKLKTSLESHKDQISKLLEKYSELKYRKNSKIMRLKNDRNTLAIIHNRLVNLLQEQCMEKDNYLQRAVKETPKSEKAMLLQEIRKNNMLSHENFQLQQENEYLQSMLNVKKSSRNGTVSL